MNKHSKSALLILAIVLGIVVVTFSVFAINLNNNTAEKYREMAQDEIAKVSSDFQSTKDTFLESTGLSEFVSKQEVTRNELFNTFYSNANLREKKTIDDSINSLVDTIAGSIDTITSKYEELTTAFNEKTEKAKNDAIKTFEENVQALTDSFQSLLDGLLQ